MAKVTSFTGEVPPLTSSAGLDIVGISESWQKLDKLVGGDAASWSCCAVCEGEVVIRAKALLTKKVIAKPEAGPFHTATRQGCQGLLATPEDGGGEGQFSLEPSEGV